MCHHLHLPRLETLEARAVPAVMTPVPAAPSPTPAAIVAPSVTQATTNSIPAQTLPQVVNLDLAGTTQAGTPTVETTSPTSAIASLSPVTAVLGDRGINDAVFNLPTGPAVDRLLATASPAASEVTSGFRGRLVFPGTGLLDRSPTVPGPFDQPPGTFLEGAMARQLPEGEGQSQTATPSGRAGEDEPDDAPNDDVWIPEVLPPKE